MVTAGSAESVGEDVGVGVAAGVRAAVGDADGTVEATATDTVGTAGALAGTAPEQAPAIRAAPTIIVGRVCRRPPTCCRFSIVVPSSPTAVSGAIVSQNPTRFNRDGRVQAATTNR
jgi:hypothetical protein